MTIDVLVQRSGDVQFHLLFIALVFSLWLPFKKKYIQLFTWPVCHLLIGAYDLCFWHRILPPSTNEKFGVSVLFSVHALFWWKFWVLNGLKCVLHWWTSVLIHEKHWFTILNFRVHFSLSRKVDSPIECSCINLARFYSLWILMLFSNELIFFPCFCF